MGNKVPVSKKTDSSLRLAQKCSDTSQTPSLLAEEDRGSLKVMSDHGGLVPLPWEQS